jgi:hypothetical protein
MRGHVAPVTVEETGGLIEEEETVGTEETEALDMIMIPEENIMKAEAGIEIETEIVVVDMVVMDQELKASIIEEEMRHSITISAALLEVMILLRYQGKIELSGEPAFVENVLIFIAASTCGRGHRVLQRKQLARRSL